MKKFIKIISVLALVIGITGCTTTNDYGHKRHNENEFQEYTERHGDKWASAAELGIRAISDAVASIDGIPVNAANNFTVYDLNGKIIANADKIPSYSTLPQGLYIVNGQKVLIK